MHDEAAAEILDLIHLEGEQLDVERHRARLAATNIELLSHHARALDHCLSVFELIGRLRDTHPDKAEEVAKVWRDIVVDVTGEYHAVLRKSLDS